MCIHVWVDSGREATDPFGTWRAWKQSVSERELEKIARFGIRVAVLNTRGREGLPRNEGHEGGYELV
jgi:hypothetical protein